MDDGKNTYEQLLTQSYVPTHDRVPKKFLQDFRTKRFTDGNVAETYHENTKIDRVTKHKNERSAELFLDDETLGYSIKRLEPDYEGYERRSLPEPDEEPTDGSLFDALGDRRSVRNYSRDAMSATTLSNFLYHSFGVSDDRAGKPVRRYPSAGGHYPVEPYFYLSDAVGRLSPGLYYYVPNDHELRQMRADDDGADVADLFADADSFAYSRPELNVFLTASFWRAYAKYGPRAYRYVLQEAGHVCQNVQLVATALGLGSIPRAGYVDDRVNDYLRVDGVNEAVVSAITVGSTNEVDAR